MAKWHIYGLVNYVTIGSDYRLLPLRRQDIYRTNWIVVNGSLIGDDKIDLSENRIKI